MIQFTDVILIALFIEVVVDAVKPIWAKDGEKLTASEYVSMFVGILLAVVCRINMLAFVVEATFPGWVEYVFFAMTGIAIGRGTNFLYDLWGRLIKWQSGEAVQLPAAPAYVHEGNPAENETWEQEGTVDMCLEDWPDELLRLFCMRNGIAMEGDEDREALLRLIEESLDYGEDAAE